jgi:hypothetical protein
MRKGLTRSKGRDVRPLALKNNTFCFEAQGIELQVRCAHLKFGCI